jgi:hypothetical protein
MNIPSILNTSAYRAVTSVQECADRQLTVVENKLPQGIQHRWHERDLEPVNIII